MEERSSTSSSRWPVAALVAVFLIVVVETMAYRNRIFGLDAVFPITNRKLAVLKDESRSFNVIVMGDSRYFHIDPAVLEKAFGGRSGFNFSWPHFGPEAYDYFLHAYLHYRRPPEIIVANFTPELITTPGHYTHIEETELVRSRAFEVLPTLPHVTNIIKRGNWKYLWLYIKSISAPPTATYRTGWLRILQSVLAGDGIPGFPDWQQRYIDEYNRTESFVISVDQQLGPNAVAEFNEKIFRLENLADPNALRRFRDFVEYARESGIVVVIVNTPIPADLLAYYKEIGVMDSFENWLQQINAYDNVVVAEPVIPIYPDELLADIGHVNAAGDKRFEEELAGRIAPLLPVIEEKLAAMRQEPKP